MIICITFHQDTAWTRRSQQTVEFSHVYISFLRHRVYCTNNSVSV